MAKFKKQSAGAVPEVRSQVLGAFQPKAESGSPWQQRCASEDEQGKEAE
jgi:hypothetical protein